mgnify:CR=1 FL=1
MKKSVLRSYARLIARTGVNIQKGQEVFIAADLDQPEFVAMLVDECYKCKAKKVVVDWNYQPLQKLHVRHRSLTTLSRVEDYELARWQHYVDTIPCRIYLISEDPDGLRGMDREKNAKGAQARSKIIKPLRDRMDNRYKWCIAAVPGKAWAQKMFPGIRASAAIEKLWEAILYTSRADGDDPIAAWDAHNADIAARCAYLNSLGIDTLHYTASNGTDFTVGLIDRSEFCGGAEAIIGGEIFNANIPSEEVYTSPKRGRAEGIVYSTKPLSYNGQLIENFSIRFHEGKVTEVHAEKNEEMLKTIVSMDEGASYLGEVALVPYSSPINQLGYLFYNTLFDENAVCHLALGEGYTNTLRGFADMTREECTAAGINDSMIHEDFMIGSEDMDIDAVCENGDVVPVFRHGNWAF